VPRRKWIKLWTQETLYRSISQELAPEERWVWIAFLCLAGDSVEPGVIMAAPGIAWTQDQLAQITKVPLPVMQSAFQKMIDAKKIHVNHGGIIYISNWEKYQTNWDRIRKYPSQSPKDKPTTEPTTFPTPDNPTTEPTKNHTTEEKRREEKKNIKERIYSSSVSLFGSFSLLQQRLRAAASGSIDRLTQHERIKQELSEIARSNGLEPQSEYEIPGGRVDICWLDSGGNVVAAFEIDVHQPRQRSFDKLQSLGCPLCCIILRAESQPHSMVSGIHLIGLGLEKPLDANRPGWVQLINSLKTFDVSDEYITEIQSDFATLDLENEAKSFVLWWSEGTKQLKRPKTAWRNWLKIAKERQQEKEAKRDRPNIGYRVPKKYTRPEEDV
jgi:hypothetical protein